MALNDWRPMPRWWMNQAVDVTENINPDAPYEENIFGGRNEHWFQGLGRWIREFSQGLANPDNRSWAEGIGRGTQGLGGEIDENLAWNRHLDALLDREQKDTFFKAATLLKPEEFAPTTGDPGWKLYEAKTDDPHANALFKRRENKWFSKAQFDALPQETKDALQEFKQPEGLEADMYRTVQDTANAWFNGENLTAEEKAQFNMFKTKLEQDTYDEYEDAQGNMVRKLIPGMPINELLQDTYGSINDRVGGADPDGWSPYDTPNKPDDIRKAPLSDTQAKEYSMAQSAYNALNDAVDIVFDLDGNLRPEYQSLTGMKFQDITGIETTPAFRRFSKAVNQAKPLVLNLRTGAAFSDLEEDFVDRLTNPSLFDSPETFRDGLMQVLDEMQTRVNSAYHRDLEVSHPAYKKWTDEREARRAKWRNYNPNNPTKQPGEELKQGDINPNTNRPINDNSADPNDWSDEKLREWYRNGRQ